MKPLLQIKSLCKPVQVSRYFVDNDGVCDKCLKLFLCEIIEQLGQNGGEIDMGELRLRWQTPMVDMKIFFPGIAHAHHDLSLDIRA